LELGTWNLELGTWNLELGTWNFMRLLLVEDDTEVANYLIKGLKENGFVVDHASDGKEGLYDVMIIDRMLPALDGLVIVKSVRAAAKATPILILSTLGEVDDRVEGLQAGADDYLTKPFAFSELIARIYALLRRSTASTSTVTELRVGDLRLDLLKHVATRSEQVIELQPREFSMLEYLMRNAGHVVTRTMLLEHVWDYQFDPQTNVIDVLISRLRGKIDSGFSKSLLHTVRGSGYMINETH
jgi:two-component system OmpR family response regulator